MALNQNRNFLIPQGDFYVVSFSGGRTSGYMLNRILEANGGLPSNAKVIFANTGKERFETLDFVNQVSLEWNVDITWLEYDYIASAIGNKRHPRHVARKVDYQSASRAGEPFEKMIKSTRYLPNVVTRTCTRELKNETVKRYLLTLGIREHTNIIGFRYDERRRAVSRVADNRLFPLIYDEVVESDVRAYWRNQAFDLAIESYQGNCDLCFLKGKSKLLALIKQDPDRANWWIRMEQGNQTFNKGYSVLDLVEYAQRQKDLPLFDDEFIDCHCTD